MRARLIRALDTLRIKEVVDLNPMKYRKQMRGLDVRINGRSNISLNPTRDSMAFMVLPGGVDWMLLARAG